MGHKPRRELDYYKFNYISENEAVELAMMLRGHWTKNRLTKAIKNLSKKPNAYGIPLHVFFDKDTIESEEFTKIFGAGVEFAMVNSGRSANWACKKILFDVLNGFLTTLKERKKK